MTHFKDVGKMLASFAGGMPSVDLRVFTNEETFRLLDNELPDQLRQYWLKPTAEDQALFESHLVRWEISGVSQWKDFMSGGEITDSYVRVLKRVWSRFPFDIILHWGENASVTQFCEQNDLIHVGMELGCTRPPYMNSYVFDPLGTNGAAIVPTLNIEDIKSIVGGQRMSAESSILGFSNSLECAPYDNPYTKIPANLSARILRGKHKKVAFLPLQLYDDANLLRFSHYDSLKKVVSEVIPKLANAGYLTIIKPHPASVHRPGAMQENLIARSAIADYEADFIWHDDPNNATPNARFVQLADLVITVNSSVGFEALYHDKPVVVLGEAVYKPHGLFPSLEQVITGTYDSDKYLENIGYLRKFFLEGYLAPEGWVKYASMFFQRIMSIAAIYQTHRGNNVEMARALFAAFNPGQQWEANAQMLSGNSSPVENNFSTPKSILGVGHGNKIRIDELKPLINLQEVMEKLKTMSSAVDKHDLIEWLDLQWSVFQTRKIVIDTSGLFDRHFYLTEYPDVAAEGSDPLDHFTAHGEAELRFPSDSVNRAVYLAQALPMRHTLIKLIEACPWNANENAQGGLTAEESLAVREANQVLTVLNNRPQKRICVVAHMYYKDLVSEILDSVGNIKEDFDLVVTTPLWGAKEIETSVKARYPDALICKVPNRGRDIAPFLFVLPTLLARKYTAILKIQTKKGYYAAGKYIREYGEAWRKHALQCLLGSEHNVQSILQSFEKNKMLNLVGPASFLVTFARYPAKPNNKVTAFLRHGEFNDKDLFFAGTMFWMRPSAFAGLNSPLLSFKNFSSDSEANDGLLEHSIERLFGHMAGEGVGRIGSLRIVESNLQPALNLAPKAVARNLNEVISALAMTH
jgi:hypothetical protein